MQEAPGHTAAVVHAHGEIDIETAPSLYLELAPALRTYPEVVLDLSRVTLLDCSGLRVLDRAHHQARRHGSRLLLRNAGPRVLRLLELTGMHQHLNVEADRPPAARHRTEARTP